MPGFLGCISTSSSIETKIAYIREYEHRTLPNHAYYAARDSLHDDNSLVLTLLPRLRATFAGTHRAPDGAGALAYIGRFEEAPFPRGADGDEIARALWELYRDRGKAFPQALAGSYLIYVADHRERRSLLVNDHFGSFQCFYAVVDGALCFAPEVNLLVDACGLAPTIDVAAVLSMFVNGHLLGSGTYLREVKGLPPGTLVEIGPEVGIRFEKHYRFAFDEPPGDLPEESYVSGLSVRLMGALESRADILADTIIPLSGGWDSRGLAAFAATVSKRTGKRIRTVTWGVPGGEEVPDTDPPIARAVATFLDTDHVYMPRPTSSWIDDFESMFTLLDGHTDDCVFHPNEHALLRHLHTELGADHIFSGNHMFGPAGEAASDLEAMARIGISHLTEYEPLWELFRQDHLDQLRGVSEDYAAQVLASCSMTDFNDRKDYLHYAQRLQNYTMRSAHYKQCAIWVHNPWLDRSILDFMRTVPPALRVKKLAYKRAMQSVFPELETIPHAGVHFDNIEDWDAILRSHGYVREYVLRHVLAEENGLHQLLDMGKLRAYVDGFLAGRPADGPRLVGIVNRAKQVLSHFPAVYRVLKRSAMQYLHVRDLTPATVLLRLLILKKVYDRYGGRRAGAGG
jgi:asparagine synthetase B (glutamine-hydrolysing)